MKRNSDYIMTKIKDPMKLAKKAQIGVDLTISKVYALKGQSTLVNAQKIKLPEYKEKVFSTRNDIRVFAPTVFLTPGFYIIEFDQGLEKLNPDENAYIVQRSSLNRAGVQIMGSVYDPGFETDTLGASMIVHIPITIQQHERVAQILIDDNEAVAEHSLYNGSWQGMANGN